MGIWFWLNIPVMLLFLGCWAGIPMWHTLRRWDAELKAKHAELRAGGVPELVTVWSAPAAVGYRMTAPLVTPAVSAIPDQRSGMPSPDAPDPRPR